MGLPGLPVHGLRIKDHVHPRTRVQTWSRGRSPNSPFPAGFSNASVLWHLERVGARPTPRFSFRRPGEGLRICIANEFQVTLLDLACTLRTTAILFCPSDCLSSPAAHPESVPNAWVRALHCDFPPKPSIMSSTLNTSAHSRLRIQRTHCSCCGQSICSDYIVPSNTGNITAPSPHYTTPNGLSDLLQFTWQCHSCSIV